MAWHKKILDALGGNLLDGVAKITEKIKEPGQKAQVKMELERLVDQQRMRAHELMTAELEAKQAIIVAELQQGDAYTKRARPTVIYAGVGFIFLNYVFLPFLGTWWEVPNLALPEEFWLAWGGIVATYSIGRSFEKRGGQSTASRVLTGSTRVDLTS